MPITNIGLPTSFVPTSIAGCSLWMDGADPAGTGIKPATGSALTTWVDKSSNTSSTPTFSGTATYNDGVVFSSSSVGGTFISAPANAIYTSFGIISATTPTNGVFSLRNPGNNDEIRVFCIIGNTNAFQKANAPGGSWATILYNSTTFPLTNTLTTSSNTTSNIGLTINGNTTSSNVSGTAYTLSTCSNWSIGWNTAKISEVILYNSILTMAQRQQIEQYLAFKWKITSYLPTTHPGYKGPPTPLSSVPYYTAFSPTSLPGCLLWLDSRDRSAMTFSSGNTLSAWRDKSGNNNNATAFASPVLTQNAINGYPAISAFRGPFFKGAISITGSNFTAFSVATSSGGNFGQRLLSFVNSNVATGDWTTPTTCIPIYIDAGSQGVLSTFRSGSGAFAGNAYSQNVPFMAVTQYTGTNGFMWFNGSNATTTGGATTGNFGVNVYGVGCQPLDLGEYWNGYIGEVLVYNTTLTTNERQQVEGYLAQKWSLTPSLPIAHLNKTRPIGLPAAVAAPISLFTFISNFMSTYYNLSGAYALLGIANTVSLSSGTPAYVWTVAVPSAAKGKNGILAIFFNLYSTTAFLTNQSFDYGVYVDGVAQLLGDSTGTLRYVNAGATNYMMSSGGISLGLNGLVNGFPLIIPVSFLASASQIQIGLKNSSAQMTGIASAAPSVTSNVVTSTGTLNTGNYVPQNTFTTTGLATYTVPTTVQGGTVAGVYIYCWGSGGFHLQAAGAGGFVSGFYPCAGGTNLRFVVGVSDNQANINTGGSGYGNGGGGGFSGVFLSNAGGVAQSNALIIAGGGGMDCYGPPFLSASGNGGGGAYGSNAFGVGYSGGNPYVYGVGDHPTVTGGTLSAGGVGMNAKGGAALIGGATTNSTGEGVGGGGGYYGGGGSTWNSGSNQGGGGGSSFAANAIVSPTFASATRITSSALASTAIPPGGNTSPFYVLNSNGYGYGGSNLPSYTANQGLVVIVPAVGTAATQIGVSAALYSG